MQNNDRSPKELQTHTNANRKTRTRGGRGHGLTHETRVDGGQLRKCELRVGVPVAHATAWRGKEHTWQGTFGTCDGMVTTWRHT